jgi:hypothetical protein
MLASLASTRSLPTPLTFGPGRKRAHQSGRSTDGDGERAGERAAVGKRCCAGIQCAAAQLLKSDLPATAMSTSQSVSELLFQLRESRLIRLIFAQRVNPTRVLSQLLPKIIHIVL